MQLKNVCESTFASIISARIYFC